VQDFNGNHIAGMHFPLKDKARVLTGFVNDDLNTPIILGQIPTLTQPSPVTNKNPYQYIIRTAQQSQFSVDDQAKQCVLENKHNKVLFHQQGITLNSCQGNIDIQSATHYTVNTGLDYTIQTNNHYQQTYHHASLLMTKQADISWQATKSLTITAKQTLQLQSHTIKIQAKNIIEFLATNQLLNSKNSLIIVALELLSHLARQTKMQATKHFTINDNVSLQPNFLKINCQALDIVAEKIQVYQNTEIIPLPL
jgi:uncharacterized protein involved in type VI secretion and phage assembly